MPCKLGYFFFKADILKELPCSETPIIFLLPSVDKDPLGLNNENNTYFRVLLDQAVGGGQEGIASGSPRCHHSRGQGWSGRK